MKRIFTTLLFLYGLASVLLLLFSYTQVDLSLTLSKASFVRTIETYFQHIGYYERPIATIFYVFLLFLWFSLYTGVLILAKKKRIDSTSIWKLILVVVTILFFSYPAAFSYDIFNYVFTAKTVVLYRQNPYLFSPLLFEHIDPMLSFMRWTHLPSAYTPFSIVAMIIPFLFSFGSLLVSSWFIRGGFILFYLLTIWVLSQIVKKENRYTVAFAIAFFALNPLVIIEVVVSGHNDSMMMFFGVLAMALALTNKKLASFFLLSLSIATKLMTVFLLPLYLLKWDKKKALLFMTIGLGLVLLRREFLPWYFLWVMPFITLFPEEFWLIGVTYGISLGLLLKYAPVYYTGGYDSPVSTIQSFVLVASTIIGLVSGIILTRYSKKRIKSTIGPS